MRASIVAMAVLTLAAANACASEGSGGTSTPSASPAATTAEASASPSGSPTPFPTADPDGEMCLHVTEMETRLASLRAIELRLPNRTALDIELDNLQAAYGELEDVDLGDREDELERSMTRLGYRLDELELAVEDFRTNTRPRRAEPHVDEDAQKLADELAAFVILSRC